VKERSKDVGACRYGKPGSEISWWRIARRTRLSGFGCRGDGEVAFPRRPRGFSRVRMTALCKAFNLRLPTLISAPFPRHHGRAPNLPKATPNRAVVSRSTMAPSGEMTTDR